MQDRLEQFKRENRDKPIKLELPLYRLHNIFLLLNKVHEDPRYSPDVVMNLESSAEIILEQILDQFPDYPTFFVNLNEIPSVNPDEN